MIGTLSRSLQTASPLIVLVVALLCAGRSLSADLNRLPQAQSMDSAASVLAEDLAPQLRHPWIKRIALSELNPDEFGISKQTADFISDSIERALFRALEFSPIAIVTREDFDKISYELFQTGLYQHPADLFSAAAQKAKVDVLVTAHMLPVSRGHSLSLKVIQISEGGKLIAATKDVLIAVNPQDVTRAARSAQNRKHLNAASSAYNNGDYSACLRHLNKIQPKSTDLPPEALFLAAKASYALGKIRQSASLFNALIDKYPNSQPVLDRRVSKSLFVAVNNLFADTAWGEAGHFVEILEPLEPSLLAESAHTLERAVEEELTRISPQLQQINTSLHQPFTSSIRSWRGRKCSSTGHCFLSDTSCVDRQDRDTEREKEAKNARNDWRKPLASALTNTKNTTARDIINMAQSYPILRTLLTNRIILHSMTPDGVPDLPSPLSYYVKETDYSGYKSGWKKYTDGKQAKRRWAVCAELSPSWENGSGFPVLKVKSFDQKKIMANLGNLIRSKKMTNRSIRKPLVISKIEDEFLQ